MMADRIDTDGGRHVNSVMEQRRLLINLTYRLLGSLAEAEDAVQETYARWYAMSRAQQDTIDRPSAWLTTVATRICLNLLRSARVRREHYVGDWIPEPLPDLTEWFDGKDGRHVDPADKVTLDESVSMAFMVVLDSMTPAERVAFILHDVFRYSFKELAEMVGRSPGACRQLASSARRRLREVEVPTAPVEQRHEVVRDFKRAWEAKDIDALVDLLDPKAQATADGGGRALAFVKPIRGSKQVARAWVTLAEKTTSAMTLLERTVNGQPGLIAIENGITVTVFAFDVVGDRIRHIWVIRNPDKLHAWTTGEDAASAR